MKFAKKIHSIVCDDIREEINNKVSLMGVYGKEIIFNQLPAILPKLYFLIMIEDVSKKFSEVTLTLKLPGSKTQIFKRPTPPKLKTGLNLNLIFGFSPFKVEKAGEARFEVRVGDSKRTNYVHKLGISKGKDSAGL